MHFMSAYNPLAVIKSQKCSGTKRFLIYLSFNLYFNLCALMACNGSEILSRLWKEKRVIQFNVFDSVTSEMSQKLILSAPNSLRG